MCLMLQSNSTTTLAVDRPSILVSFALFLSFSLLLQYIFLTNFCVPEFLAHSSSWEPSYSKLKEMVSRILYVRRANQIPSFLLEPSPFLFSYKKNKLVCAPILQDDIQFKSLPLLSLSSSLFSYFLFQI